MCGCLWDELNLSRCSRFAFRRVTGSLALGHRLRVLNIVGVEPLVRYLRNDLKAARTSSENSFGSSQAAKCPPRSASLE